MSQVILPRLSLAMEEGKIIRWLVAEGARVTAGQSIAEIETDKAVTEVEASATGTIHFVVEEGATVAVESPLAEIAENTTAPADRANATTATARISIAAAAAPAGQGLQASPASSPASTESTAGQKHRASPAARRVARERGLDSLPAHGSGPGGRITIRDLEDTGSAARASLRASVVAQLAASWREIPHIQIGGELDGSGLAAAKRAAPTGITVTDLLILAVVRALRDVPELNGTLGNLSEHVHLALAVATPSGVIAPVIRNAHECSLAEIARSRTRLVTAARAGTSDRRDLAGGTITLTNLGAYPVDFFAPIVSGPQVAMFATGRLIERPVAVNGSVAIRHRIWVNVAIDHRGGDGVTGARFLASLEQSMNRLSNELAQEPV
jgi:pyruvate dehydrogenase E2 component (dihydrolipoamide acetyltransferase)